MKLMEIENALLSVRVSKLVDLIAMAQREAVAHHLYGIKPLPYAELAAEYKAHFRKMAERWLIENIEVIR